LSPQSTGPARASGHGLADTEVTDSGLNELAALKSLQALDLFGTQATDAVLKELRKALPNCEVKD